jgi:hypothetical protein
VTRSPRWAAQADPWAAWADERHEDDVLPLFYDLLPDGAVRALDDPALAVNEAGRMLASGGRLCASIVHPIASAGSLKKRVISGGARGTRRSRPARGDPTRPASAARRR